MEKEEAFESGTRYGFANKICKLIIDKNKGSLDLSVVEIKDFREELEAHVRNFYENVEHVPLIYLYELITFGADNYGLSKKEHDAQIEKVRKQAVKFYR